MEVQPYEFSVITIPILQMRKLRPKWRGLSHILQWDKCSNWDLNWCVLKDSKFCASSGPLHQFERGAPFLTWCWRHWNSWLFCDWAPKVFPELWGGELKASPTHRGSQLVPLLNSLSSAHFGHWAPDTAKRLVWAAQMRFGRFGAFSHLLTVFLRCIPQQLSGAAWGEEVFKTLMWNC